MNDAPLHDITWFTATAGQELVTLVRDGVIQRGDRIVELDAPVERKLAQGPSLPGGRELSAFPGGHACRCSRPLPRAAHAAA